MGKHLKNISEQEFKAKPRGHSFFALSSFCLLLMMKDPIRLVFGTKVLHDIFFHHGFSEKEINHFYWLKAVLPILLALPVGFLCSRRAEISASIVLVWINSNLVSSYMMAVVPSKITQWAYLITNSCCTSLVFVYFGIAIRERTRSFNKNFYSAVIFIVNRIWCFMDINIGNWLQSVVFRQGHLHDEFMYVYGILTAISMLGSFFLALSFCVKPYRAPRMNKNLKQKLKDEEKVKEEEARSRQSSVFVPEAVPYYHDKAVDGLMQSVMPEGGECLKKMSVHEGKNYSLYKSEKEGQIIIEKRKMNPWIFIVVLIFQMCFTCLEDYLKVAEIIPDVIYNLHTFDYLHALLLPACVLLATFSISILFDFKSSMLAAMILYIFLAMTFVSGVLIYGSQLFWNSLFFAVFRFFHYLIIDFKNLICIFLVIHYYYEWRYCFVSLILMVKDISVSQVWYLTGIKQIEEGEIQFMLIMGGIYSGAFIISWMVLIYFVKRLEAKPYVAKVNVDGQFKKKANVRYSYGDDSMISSAGQSWIGDDLEVSDGLTATKGGITGLTTDFGSEA